MTADSQPTDADPTLSLARELIRRRSVTPEDAGCQEMLAELLGPAGFDCESMPFGEVTNLWARRGHTAPLFCFAGHTDVVPPGQDELWSSEPFTPTVRTGKLYGRGAADMKSSLAAMVIAVRRFVERHPDHKGSIAFLITSDEEGRAREGTLKVVEALSARGERIDWCLVGEPSSRETLGDVVRIGRRGSLSGEITVRGVQGHVAYPDLADNPIAGFAPLLAELCGTRWDDGNEHFPPTSFQVVRIASDGGAVNVIPGALTARFNFRYSTEWTHELLQARVEKMVDTHGLDAKIAWHLSGEPFLTSGGPLVDAVQKAVSEQLDQQPELSTGGGTSDGRFIAPAGADVVELGPVNASIHKVDEHVLVADLPRLADVYEAVLERLLT